MPFSRTGPWQLPIAGYVVSRLVFGPDVDLVLDGPTEMVSVGLSDCTELLEPSGARLQLSPRGDWTELAAVLHLIGDSVSSAIASDELGLQIAFTSGSRLTTPPSPTVETWEVTGESYKLVGTPGGVDISDAVDWSRPNKRA
jgi:hypothetical protein